MNVRQVRWHFEAGAEAEAAARWYRERSATAGKRFVGEIKQAIETIQEAPRRWPAEFRNTRKVKLPCFPFLVVYRESDQTVEILAIAHGSRRPGYWQERA